MLKRRLKIITRYNIPRIILRWPLVTGVITKVSSRYPADRYFEQIGPVTSLHIIASSMTINSKLSINFQRLILGLAFDFPSSSATH